MVSARQKLILKNLVGEYINSAIPVSSAILVNNYNLPFSPATVRNEILELENLGYLYQPHVSAGRIPTEEGYRFFINFLTENQKAELSKKEKKKINFIVREFRQDRARLHRELVKTLSQVSGNFVFGETIETRELCHSGFGNLFHEPELRNLEIVCRFCDIFDNLENDLEKLIGAGQGLLDVFVGKENPIPRYHDFSLLLSELDFLGENSILGFLGPKRMNYKKSYALMDYIRKVFN